MPRRELLMRRNARQRRMASRQAIQRSGVRGFQPHLSRARVGLQALAVGQHAGDTAQLLGALGADFDQAGAFLKVVHAQRA